MFDLTGLGFDNSVVNFRLAFGSSNSNNSDGINFDNFKVTEIASTAVPASPALRIATPAAIQVAVRYLSQVPWRLRCSGWLRRSVRARQPSLANQAPCSAIKTPEIPGVFFVQQLDFCWVCASVNQAPPRMPAAANAA